MKDFYIIVKIGEHIKSFFLGHALSKFDESCGRILTYGVLDIYTQRKDDNVVISSFLNDALYYRLRMFVVPCIKAIGVEKIEIFVTDAKYNIIYSSVSNVSCSRGRIVYK